MRQHTIELTDIYRSAFHLCMGGDLVEIRSDKTGSNRPMMIFVIKGMGLEKLDSEYRHGRALVNPLQLRESVNHLRDILHARLRKNKGRSKNDTKRPHKGHQKWR